LRECLAISEKKASDGWTTADTRSLLGEALARKKDFAAADPLLLNAQMALLERLTRSDPSTATRPCTTPSIAWSGSMRRAASQPRQRRGRSSVLESPVLLPQLKAGPDLDSILARAATRIAQGIREYRWLKRSRIASRSVESRGPRGHWDTSFFHLRAVHD
jgi:hypothetical protein